MDTRRICHRHNGRPSFPVAVIQSKSIDCWTYRERPWRGNYQFNRIHVAVGILSTKVPRQKLGHSGHIRRNRSRFADAVMP